MFTPSPYQQAIFDFLSRESGHLQIAAVAGSGKTTTLIEALKRLPVDQRERALMCAFNKEIARALESKVPEGVTVRTIHAIGFATLTYHLAPVGARWAGQVKERKYRELIDRYWTQMKLRRECDPETEAENLAFRLIHFARVTLTDPTPCELEALAVQHELALPDDEEEWDQVLRAVPVILQWGAEGVPEKDGTRSCGPDQLIDFDDMLYLPWRLGLKPRQFKVVMVDEAQDLSHAQLSLVLKSLTPNGRLVAVGDPRQAIYAFTGADAEAFDRIRLMTKATLLPLSVCYRCPRAVIRLAQTLVPEIEAAPGAPEGAAREISPDVCSTIVTNRDMVLCRANAPLISFAFQLLAEGKPAKVRGRDIGTLLARTIDQVAKRCGDRFLQFLDTLGEWEEEQRKIARRKGSESLEQSIVDRAECCRAVFEGAVCEGATSIVELRAWVDRIFADEGAGHILLSSIHRAKGLEADRVFLLRPDLLPHPAAKTAAAREQELNLQYVAYTRAMRDLFIVKPGEN